MDNQTDKELHEALVRLKAEGPDVLRFGICYAVDVALGEGARFRVIELCAEWPESTGSSQHPVPYGLHDGWTNISAFGREEIMWNPDHPYGAARLRLLDWLIERTKV